MPQNSESLVAQPNVTWTQSTVDLPAGVSTPLVGSSLGRRALRWQVTGANPMTVVPGAGPAVAGVGFSYNPGQDVGYQGGSDAFGPNEVSTQAFTAVSQAGTTAVVWEGR